MRRIGCRSGSPMGRSPARPGAASCACLSTGCSGSSRSSAIHDDSDLAHTGFTAFRDFIRVIKPRYFLHGHTLAYRDNIAPPVTMLGTTSIINVNPYRIIEV